MPIVILPAGLHPLGSTPDDLAPLPSPPVILADGISDTTKDFASFLYGSDPIDEQVYIALNVLRGSGAAVETVGQRFQDIRKLTDNVVVLIEQEARTALARLASNGDISIVSITVTKDDAGCWAECVIDYINNRLPTPKARQARVPLRPEATTS